MILLPAVLAYAPVHAKKRSAPLAGPFLGLGIDERIEARFIYRFEILDHAHSIFGPVALVELFQTLAGGLFAGVAE